MDGLPNQNILTGLGSLLVTVVCAAFLTSPITPSTDELIHTSVAPIREVCDEPILAYSNRNGWSGRTSGLALRCSSREAVLRALTGDHHHHLPGRRSSSRQSRGHGDMRRRRSSRRRRRSHTVRRHRRRADPPRVSLPPEPTRSAMKKEDSQGKGFSLQFTDQVEYMGVGDAVVETGNMSSGGGATFSEKYNSYHFYQLPSTVRLVNVGFQNVGKFAGRMSGVKFLRREVEGGEEFLPVRDDESTDHIPNKETVCVTVKNARNACFDHDVLVVAYDSSPPEVEFRDFALQPLLIPVAQKTRNLETGELEDAGFC